MMLSRREILLCGAAALASRPALANAAAASEDNRPATLERLHNGRLGVAILDTGNGKRLSYRADERFGLCSTFKFLAAAAVLARVDRREDDLARRISYGKADLLDYAPETGKHVGDGMTLGELCAAAIELSDNTAGNLLLTSLGGPSGITHYARSLGDEITRLDRTEPTLNIITPGDPRDTTTPAAMLGLIQSTLTGDALSPASRKQLQDWLLGCKTGANRITAGLPAGWRIGDKTGTGAKAEANDIAIIWPPKREPILVAAYYEGGGEPPAARDAVLAGIGRLIAEGF